METTNLQKKGLCPYKDLYIYYFEGCLNRKNNITESSFIGNWEESGSTFLFFSKPSDKVVEDLLAVNPQMILMDNYNMTYDQWQGDAVTSFCRGGFYITPPWEKSENSYKNKIHITLDPGIVFGTGTHPTTNNCLDALEIAFDMNKIDTVVDLGTGTGLLALAAAASGSSRVIAVDLNFLAAKTAEKNIGLNHFNDKILALCGKAEDMILCPVDLVIANIHYDVMKDLITPENLTGKKMLILSGLFRSQVKDIAHKLSLCNVQIIKRWSHEDTWYTFLAKQT